MSNPLEWQITTFTHTAPKIGAVTTAALAENQSRKYALFVNDGTEPIYIKMAVVAALNEGIRLNAGGGSYEMSQDLDNLNGNAVNGICASGNMTLLVTEGV